MGGCQSNADKFEYEISFASALDLSDKLDRPIFCTSQAMIVVDLPKKDSLKT